MHRVAITGIGVVLIGLAQTLFGSAAPSIACALGIHGPTPGHALGATPAIETALLALTLAGGCAPPTTNLDRADDGVELDFSGTVPRRIRARYGLKNAFGFGGLNACLVLAAPDGETAPPHSERQDQR